LRQFRRSPRLQQLAFPPRPEGPGDDLGHARGREEEDRDQHDGVFEATTVLTKCGSRYEAMPEEMAG